MHEQAVILVADDSEDDLVLIRRAFEKARIFNPLHTVQSGDEAIAYLAGQGKYFKRSEFPLPDLFLLDLHMPGTDGFEVLAWIRQHPGLQSLRVVILTSSDFDSDVNQAYHFGANSFLVKPLDFRELVDLTKILHNHWILKSKAPEIFRERIYFPPRRGPGSSDNGNGSPPPAPPS